MGLLKKLFGTSSEKELRAIKPIVDKIEALDGEYSKLTDEQLKAKTPEFKQRIANGESLDDILPEAFAACREAAWRVLGMKPYRVQLIGGIILHQGRIAEMKTGEGKTLVATLPATSTPWRERACTSSPSTTTWPSATASGWARSTASWASPWAW